MSTRERFLTIDVGNTHLSLGVFDDGRLARPMKLDTHTDETRLWHQISEALGEKTVAGLSRVGISSVVSGKGEALRRSAPLAAEAVLVFDRDTAWPMQSLYSKTLGADRMIAAIAARRLFGSPVIVADIGTAGTIDVVDQEGSFAGGIILAGAGLRSRALHEFTSVLPQVEPSMSPPRLLGRDTESAIVSGLFHGLREEVIGLTIALRLELGVEAPVVVTGTGAILFKESPDEKWHIEPWLTLHGIYETGKALH